MKKFYVTFKQIDWTGNRWEPVEWEYSHAVQAWKHYKALKAQAIRTACFGKKNIEIQYR